MKRPSLTACLAVLVVVPLLGCKSATITFNSLPMGQMYGPAHGQSNGDQILNEDHVKVTVNDFATSNARTRVQPALAYFGSNNVMLINNLTMGFDFTAVSFPVAKVQIPFVDSGNGQERMSVNGSPLRTAQILSMGTTWPGGVTMVVTASPQGNNQVGKIVLTGNVHNLRIGGDEFWVDNVKAED